MNKPKPLYEKRLGVALARIPENLNYSCVCIDGYFDENTIGELIIWLASAKAWLEEKSKNQP